MKMFSRISLVLAIGALTLIPAVSRADTFDYVYTGGDGVSATLDLTGSSIGGGEFLITSGTIDVTGGPLAGVGTLVTNPNSPGTTTNTTLAGGGTYLTYDDLLSPGANPVLDDNGLLFAIDGTAASIWGNSPGSYSLFEGNWAEYDSGKLTSIPSTTPEPSSLFLLGTGLLGGAGLISRRRKLSHS